MPETTLKQKVSLLLFGLLLGVILLEAGLRLGGFISTSLQERANRRSLKDRGEYVVMCLGESTTALRGETDYPHQLEEVLNGTDLGIEFSVINKGIPGTNTNAILSSLEDNLKRYQPDMVITMMGINDQLVGRRTGDGMEKRTEYYFQRFRVWKLTELLKKNIVYKFNEIKDYLTSSSYQRYLKQARSLNLEGNFIASAAIYLDAINIDPGKGAAYAELGRLYVKLDRKKEAEKVCRKAIELEARNEIALAHLGLIYESAGDWDKAQVMYVKALKVEPTYNFPLSQLASHYSKRGDYRKVEEICSKLIAINPAHEQAWSTLALCYQAQQKRELAEQCFEKADELWSESINPEAIKNYRKLKEIVFDRRGIRLVCVQYPMKKVEYLEKMLPRKDGVIFIDNKEIFKKAVEREGYDSYFEDRFGGDFGHCTRKGNRLLAENIAGVILREVFNIGSDREGAD